MLAEKGIAVVSGPMGDDGDLRGLTLYHVKSQEEAEKWANADPAVQAGRLRIEVKPWWAAKGIQLP